MAAVEDLIKQIADPRLRDQLAAEVAKLKSQKKFGLVFEEHLPEMLRLPNMTAVVGSRVLKKDDPAVPYVVTAEINGKRIRIRPESGGGDEVVQRSEVVVAKAFGEAMYPALIPVDTIERGGPDKPWHVLINADNYHALQLLLYGYEGKVDVIYIDPPYNSGARDWKYNNDYVDGADQFRHSKWLSMIAKRLLLAKRLLKPDGVLIVTIDENEVGHLSVLLEMHFPEYLRHMVSVVINPKGTGKLNFARVDEYAFFCVPNNGTSVVRGVPGADAKTMGPGEGALFFPKGSAASLFPEALSEPDEDDEEAEDDIEEDEEDIQDAEHAPADLPFPIEELPDWELRHARRRGSESSYRHQRPGQFYPIYIDEKARRVVRAGSPIPLEAKPNFSKVDGLTPIWPIDKENNDRCWRFFPPTMDPLIQAGKVKLGKYNEKHKSWTLNIWERKPESKKLKTVWWKRAHDAGTHGTTLLHKILGRRGTFPFPKSIYAVADALAAVVRTRPDAIVLDFFAGSGTTLQATCMLNTQFGGNRRCILATNNEVGEKLAAKLRAQGIEPGDAKYEQHGIGDSVTWPRTKAVISGKRQDGRKVPGAYLSGRDMAEGFEENAAYFKLDFLDPTEVNRGDKFESIVPILWMLAGCRGGPEVSRGSGKWFIPKHSPFAVLLKEDEFAGFTKALAERPDVTHAFLVTDSTDHFHRMSRTMGKKRRCIQLYRSYIDTFRINLTEPGTISAGGVPVQTISPEPEATP
jgi:adenine-specific DNA-methyltransferase